MDISKMILNIKKLANPIVENLGYELVDVTYEEIEGERYITIVIYKKEGITFEDCKLVSKALDEPLDELNPTNDLSYSLNVSSLGLDRPLVTKRDYERYLGKLIEVLVDNKIVGEVLEVNDDEIKLKVKNTTKTIKYSQIKKATAYIKF